MTTRNKKTDAQTADILEREKRSLELRRQGYSYRAIGERTGVSHVQAMNDVAQSLAYIRDDVAKDATNLRDLEVARLDHMLLKLEPMIDLGSMDAMDMALKIANRRSKLLGLDAPVKVQELTWRDQAIADIKAGTITYDALREAFDDSLAASLFASAGVPIQAR